MIDPGGGPYTAAVSDPRSGPSAADEPQDAYLQAGLVYGVLGLVILMLVGASPELVRPERRGDLVQLIVGLPFFVLFAFAIARGDRPIALFMTRRGADPERADRIGAWFREKLVILLSLSALGRTYVFAANGLGARPRLRFRELSVGLEPQAPDPRMLIAALLMATIFVFLVRASWLPFFGRLFRLARGGGRVASGDSQ